MSIDRTAKRGLRPPPSSAAGGREPVGRARAEPSRSQPRGGDSPPPSNEAAESSAPKKKAPGHVEFDSRGNSVWRWDVEQGDSTSVLLKSLHVDDLELEPTRSVRAKVGEAPKPRSKSSTRGSAATDPADEPRGGRGFDPYNRS